MSSVEVTKCLISGKDIFTYSISMEKLETIVDEPFTEDIEELKIGKWFNIVICNIENFNGEKSMLYDINDKPGTPLCPTKLEENVVIDKTWLLSCWRNYIFQLKLEKSNKIIIESIPETKTIFEDCIEKIAKSAELIKAGKFNESIALLETCLEYTDFHCYSTVLYNIACSYSCLNNEEKTFEFLESSFEYGWSNWRHMIIDVDFENFNTHPRFVTLLNKMKNQTGPSKNGGKGAGLYSLMSDN